MRRIDVCNTLYQTALSRYRKEYPEKEITNEFADRLWYSIQGILHREGEEAAKRYVETAKLW